eukprot:3218211-Pleurochrysis_carterae.AAC.4
MSEKKSERGEEERFPTCKHVIESLTETETETEAESESESESERVRVRGLARVQQCTHQCECVRLSVGGRARVQVSACE